MDIYTLEGTITALALKAFIKINHTYFFTSLIAIKLFIVELVYFHMYSFTGLFMCFSDCSSSFVMCYSFWLSLYHYRRRRRRYLILSLLLLLLFLLVSWSFLFSSSSSSSSSFVSPSPSTLSSSSFRYIYLSIYLAICLSVCLSVYLSIYLSSLSVCLDLEAICQSRGIGKTVVHYATSAISRFRHDNYMHTQSEMRESWAAGSIK